MGIYLGETLISGKSVSALAPDYTVTNVTPDRAYDANSTTINELADVLGTVIDDMNTYSAVGGPVALSNGGTGETTQQAAIDALTDVSAATTAQVLTKDGSGNATFQDAGGGGFALLDSSTLGSGATSLTSGTFTATDNLMIKIFIPSKNAVDFNSFAALQFNADTGSNYGAAITVNGGAVNLDSTKAHMLIEYIGSAPVVNVSSTHSDINISNLSGQNKFINLTTGSRNTSSTAIFQTQYGSGIWGSTAQITSIKLITRGGTATLATGTRMDIYGY